MIGASLKLNLWKFRVGDTLLANFFEKSEEINRVNGIKAGHSPSQSDGITITPDLVLSIMIERKPRSCLGRRKENEEEWLSRMEQERSEGRALLRHMVVKSDDLDWGGVIRVAEELHRKEERSISRRERKCRQRHTKRALDKRRKADAVGSFSVNLLTMRTYEEDHKVFRGLSHHANGTTSLSRASSYSEESENHTIDISSVYTPGTHSGATNENRGVIHTNRIIVTKGIH